ncbi:MAG: aminoglycoside phosphotransferase family protein [Chloroflexi bacterium]|nr:aminoglycoside phosphotransferase family protein [Chloroflexota bacterium]
MLEKPDSHVMTIINCFQENYGLAITTLEFLPLGADRDTAVYKAVSTDETFYFVKLRRGDFDEMPVIVPDFLAAHGVKNIIPPLHTITGQIWTLLDDYKVTVSPFVEGQSGFEVDLSEQQWLEFGQALKTIHTTEVPSTIAARIRREDYSSHWRETVRKFQRLIVETTFDDPVSVELSALLKRQEDVINRLVERASYLASILLTQANEYVLCHADIHAGNVLIDAVGNLYIVDWDTMLLAPKERDLMFIGGGIVKWNDPQESEWFYRGYGDTDVDPVALTYYRHERIVEDIVVYCEEILLTDGDSEDRKVGLRQLSSQFEPGSMIEIAFATEKLLPQEHKFG